MGYSSRNESESRETMGQFVVVVAERGPMAPAPDLYKACESYLFYNFPSSFTTYMFYSIDSGLFSMFSLVRYT
jgi:hypothetical protein